MVALTTSFQSAEGTKSGPAATTRRLQELLRFAGLMLSAGDTTFRVRRSMGEVAAVLGLESLSVQVGARNLVASGSRNGETVTLVRDVAIPSVNTERIGVLEELARCMPFDMPASEFGAQLDPIENAPPRYTVSQIAAAVGAACLP